MIFSPALAKQVRRGAKTQIRRPIKRERFAGGLYVIKACRYRVGRDYAIQEGRGKPETGRVEIRNRRLQRLRAITVDDARAEGFKTIARFADYWMRVHDLGWPLFETAPCPTCMHPDYPADELDPGVDVCAECDNEQEIVFEVLPADDEILDRFYRLHGDTQVWAITLEYIADEARLLIAGSPNSPGGRARLMSARKVTPNRPHPKDIEQRLTDENQQTHGYTATAAMALPHEPEAIDIADLDKLWKQVADILHGDARGELEVRGRAEREKLPLAARVVLAAEHARRRNINIQSELYLLRQHVREQRPPAAITRRVELLEQRVYPITTAQEAA